MDEQAHQMVSIELVIGIIALASAQLNAEHFGPLVLPPLKKEEVVNHNYRQCV